MIAPPSAQVNVDSPVRWFTTVEAFDRWRLGGPVERTLQAAVDEALRQLGCKERPRAIRGALAWLSERKRVPRLKDIVQQCSSRRTFYRAWASIPETPTQFLDRVRRIHASSLLASGYESADAAHVSGFSSIASMMESLSTRGGGA